MWDLVSDTVPVSKPDLLMSDASPVEGSTMWMRCNVESGTEPIRYVWQHEAGSGSITTLSQGNSSVITITNVHRNHTGWYRCVAGNYINSESSDQRRLDVICKQSYITVLFVIFSHI